MNYMLNLIDWLNERTKEYDAGSPTVSDQEWDKKYFELQNLERNTGIVYPNSPTENISFHFVLELNTVKHNHPMLSLSKTKDIDEVERFLGDKDSIAMAKMDGLTISLRYLNGTLVSAETRGNGSEGEDVLHNALKVKNIPRVIPYKDELIVDGEIICTYSSFEKFKGEYSNPRNFAAGSIRLLDSATSKERDLTFIAWDCIKGLDDLNTLGEKLRSLMGLGFAVVPYVENSLPQHSIEPILSLSLDYPIDGIVFKYNNCDYYNSLGATSHHPSGALAYKFSDEEYETTLQDIEWGTGRGNALTPVAIFDPVGIDDTVISRANLHNLDIMQDTLGIPYVGQKIWITKRNQIIPHVERAEKTDIPENEIKLITVCPICGHETSEEVSADGVRNLICANDNCSGKTLNRINYFLSNKGLNIKGLSLSTLEKLHEWGWVNNFSDVFKLREKATEWKTKDGFGEKSVDKILDTIDAATATTLEAFIAAIGIPLIGKNVAKEIAQNVESWEDFRQKVDSNFNWGKIDGFGFSKTLSINGYDYTWADDAFKYLTLSNEGKLTKEKTLSNIVVVITGKLKYFKNREALQTEIEQHGGKVTSSISKSTNILINNDVNSTSSKNLKAKDLGIPIMSEEEFMNKFFVV